MRKISRRLPALKQGSSTCWRMTGLKSCSDFAAIYIGIKSNPRQEKKNYTQQPASSLYIYYLSVHLAFMSDRCGVHRPSRINLNSHKKKPKTNISKLNYQS